MGIKSDSIYFKHKDRPIIGFNKLYNDSKIHFGVKFLPALDAAIGMRVFIIGIMFLSWNINLILPYADFSAEEMLEVDKFREFIVAESLNARDKK